MYIAAKNCYIFEARKYFLDLHFSYCRNAVKKIRGCVFTTHPLLYKGIKNLIRALPLGEAFASRQ